MFRILTTVLSLSLVTACEKTYEGRTNTPFPIREFKVLGRSDVCADTTWLLNGIGSYSDSVFATTTIPERFQKEGQIIQAKYLDVTLYPERYFFCPFNTQGEPANVIYIVEVVGWRE